MRPHRGSCRCPGAVFHASFYFYTRSVRRLCFSETLFFNQSKSAFAILFFRFLFCFGMLTNYTQLSGSTQCSFVQMVGKSMFVLEIHELDLLVFIKKHKKTYFFTLLSRFYEGVVKFHRNAFFYNCENTPDKCIQNVYF